MDYTKNRITRVSEEWDTMSEEDKSRLRRVKSGSKLFMVIRFCKGYCNITYWQFFSNFFMNIGDNTDRQYLWHLTCKTNKDKQNSILSMSVCDQLRSQNETVTNS